MLRPGLIVRAIALATACAVPAVVGAAGPSAARAVANPSASPGTPAAANAALARSDDAFLAAREAFIKGQSARLAEIAPRVRGHALQPYVDYWQLLLRLDVAQPGEISDFFTRHDGSLVAENVRREWLKQLGRRGEWTLFDAAYPNLVNEDADVTCFAILSRAGNGDAEAATDMRRFWNMTRDLPQGCVAVAETEIAAGRLTNRHVWDRVRLLLDAKQMRAAARTMEWLPDAERPDAKVVNAIHSDPKRWLDKQSPDLARRANREMTLFAIVRVAQRDPDAAAGYWARVEKKFTREEQGYLWGQLAVNAAKNHHPSALEWYGRAENTPLSDEQLAWRARAAMREDRWTDVKAAVDAMSVTGRADPTWVYWEGRALRASGDADGAAQRFKRIAGEHHFYGKLATEELGDALAVPARTQMPTTADLEEAAKTPGLVRALALFRLDLRGDGVREWNWTVRGMDDRQLLAAAELARRYEIWDRAINTAERTQSSHDFSMRFLAPYRDAFAGGAKLQGLDEAWVLGLVRQESRFMVGARSPVGASGLMQLMPATAKWMAKKIGMTDYSPARVTDPDVNIALGTGYLRYVLDELDGSPVLAAAAYNAGPGRARRWKADRPLEGAVYAESIPFNETRDYVKKVMSNTMYYTALYGGEIRPLKARLGTIPPRKGGEGYAGTITGTATVQ
jgi:soluble lytic murein transglycosylase